jgi:hypothetical protein
MVAPAPAGSAERSPWAPPSTPASQAATAPAAAIPAVAPTAPPAAAAPAAPEATAPVAPAAVAAPVVPPPSLAAPILGTGKKTKASDDPKGKFRETMWFKKGELDAQAAQDAAEEHARTGKLASDKADHLPIDERYKDDGSLSRSDKHKYSLRTGATMTTTALRESGSHSGGVPEDALIGEMKRGRGRILALIAIGVAVLVVILIAVFR